MFWGLWLLSPEHYKAAFNAATPLMFGEVALMLWLLILGVRPRPSPLAAPVSAV